MSYVELHCHSGFSLLDGASNPETLVARAAKIGMPAIALTDHDDLGGAVRWAQAGDPEGIQTIIGLELTIQGRESPAGSRESSTSSHNDSRLASRDLRS